MFLCQPWYACPSHTCIFLVLPYCRIHAQATCTGFHAISFQITSRTCLPCLAFSTGHKLNLVAAPTGLTATRAAASAVTVQVAPVSAILTAANKLTITLAKAYGSSVSSSTPGAASSILDAVAAKMDSPINDEVTSTSAAIVYCIGGAATIKGGELGIMSAAGCRNSYDSHTASPWVKPKNA